MYVGSVDVVDTGTRMQRKTDIRNPGNRTLPELDTKSQWNPASMIAVIDEVRCR